MVFLDGTNLVSIVCGWSGIAGPHGLCMTGERRGGSVPLRFPARRKTIKCF
jgi:hypothetical protein